MSKLMNTNGFSAGFLPNGGCFTDMSNAGPLEINFRFQFMKKTEEDT